MPSATYVWNDTKVGKKSSLNRRAAGTAQIPFMNATVFIACQTCRFYEVGSERNGALCLIGFSDGVFDWLRVVVF